MTLIGTDLGLLDKPRAIDETLSLSCAERADVVIDFAAYPGQRLKLVNTVRRPRGCGSAGRQHPVSGRDGIPRRRIDRADAAHARDVVRDFRRLSAADVPPHAVERFVLTSYDKSGVMPQLWEMQEVGPATPAGDGIVQVAMPSDMRDPAPRRHDVRRHHNFFAAADTWEKWHFINVVTPPGPPIDHPMHIHLINFQVVIGARSTPAAWISPQAAPRRPITLGAQLPVLPEESGWKDTITVAPTRWSPWRADSPDRPGR